MITLAETLKLVKPECDEENLFYVRKQGTKNTEIFNSAEEIKQAFDIENTYVVRIFFDTTYKGLDIEYL